MTRFSTACLLTFALSGPVVADTRAAVEDHILPRYAAFAEAAQTLADIVAVDCTASGMMDAYHSAYDRWISVSHIQFGPIETRGVVLAIAFWPDPKDRTGKAISRLLSEGAIPDQDGFRDVSIAVQGFPALERLLFEAQPDEEAACALRVAIATYIAEMAEGLNTDWTTGYGKGFAKGDVASYQTPAEARRALYTALSTSLAFVHDARLGRPLGTFDRPRPYRAEAHRSVRSQRHLTLSLQGLKGFTETSFADVMTDELRNAFDTAIARAEGLDDPDLSGVADPARRFRVEVLHRAVRDVQLLVAAQIAGALGITAGFNSLDGD